MPIRRCTSFWMRRSYSPLDRVHGYNSDFSLVRSLESLADIIHTKDGSAVVRELLARGVAKVCRTGARS